MPLVGSYLETHTAKPTSAFECVECHEPIEGDYVLHKYLHAGPKGGRYSRNYRYHPDCHDTPDPAPSPFRPRDSSPSPGLTTPQLALIGVALVAVILGGFALYDWWKKKKALTA